MISPVLKIAIFALICSMSLAGILSSADGPYYHPKEFYKKYLCDHTKPTDFPPAYKSQFNCTRFVVLNNGNFVCDDDPCSVYYSRSTSVQCTWQIEQGSPTFPDGSRMSTTYLLRPCEKCNSENCDGRYYTDSKVCPYAGRMLTNDNGVTWYCEADTCIGQTRRMKMQPDGTYACIDSTCASVMMWIDNRGWVCPGQSTASPASTFIPWVIVALLSLAVLYLARQKRNQEKPNQYNAHY